MTEFGNVKKAPVSGGTSICTLLTVAFVVLKLCHVIDWSWWWVLSPLLISLGLTLIILIVIGIVYYNMKK